jgi:hypothetical protein
MWPLDAGGEAVHSINSGQWRCALAKWFNGFADRRWSISCCRLSGHSGRINGRNLVSVRNLSTLFACLVFLVAAFALLPERVLAQNSAHCDGYARDHAQRNSTGHVADGAVTGAIGGALIGGIIGGGGGLAVGALVGGGTGAIVGSDDKSRHYNSLYHSAYNNCMRG